MPANTDAEELVTAAEIGRRIGLSGQRIRQLSQDGRLPAPIGRAGQNVLWRWQDVADWAAATSRLDPDDGRPPSQIWQVRRSKRRRFERSVDTVVPFGRRSLVHVRVWRPLEPGLRDVVLLGNLDDNHGPSVTNTVELAAMTVCSDLLGADGLQADWYEYWPAGTNTEHEFSAVTFEVRRVRPRLLLGRDRGVGEIGRRLGGALADPKWSQVPAARLEDLVGESIELYPHRTYTADTVRQFVNDGAPVEVDWDPEGLRDDVDAAHRLLRDLEDPAAFDVSAAVALLTGDWVARAAANAESASTQPENLAVRLVVYAPPASCDWLEPLRATPESPDPAAVCEGARRWLHEHGTTFDKATIVDGPDGLVDIPWWMAGVSDTPVGSGPVADAVRRAKDTAARALAERATLARPPEHPTAVPSTPFSAAGRIASRYLDTVGWWGPADEDEWAAFRLRTRFDDAADVRFGYDPAHKLVATSEGKFAVDWPVGTMAPPAAGTVVADAWGPDVPPVFVEGHDGRVHPLPLAPHNWDSGPSFTWGYSGTGPVVLTAALVHMLLAADLVDETDNVPDVWRRVHDLVVALPETDLRLPIDDLVGVVRGPGARR